MPAGYTECVKLNEYLKGSWFVNVFLLCYGENKNRIGHCESIYIMKMYGMFAGSRLHFENKVIAGQFL